jgi:outer membrane protein assembly factor BamB
MTERINSLIMLALLATLARADDWPQFRGPNRDSVWHETGTLQAFPAGGLTIRWRAVVGAGFSSPSVAQGRVFLTDCQIEKPKAWERVLCLDEVTGAVVWTHKYPVAYPEWALGPSQGGPRATPLVQNGRVFTLGAMGHLFCLEASSGNLIWEKDLAKEYQVKEFTGITASPLIEENLLILYICGKPEACVVALEKASGREVWRALDDAFSYSSPIVFTAGGKRQLVVWTQQGITSLDPKTGKPHWREEFRTSGDQTVSTPVFRNNRLLLSGLMFQLSADGSGATVLWPAIKPEQKRILSDTSTPLLDDEFLFAGKSSGTLVCLAAATGKQRWEVNSVTAAGHGSSLHLTANGDSVLIFTDEGNLIRARSSPERYEELGRAHLIDPTYPYGGRKVAWTPPAYANRHVFVRSDQEVVCASLATKQ